MAFLVFFDNASAAATAAAVVVALASMSNAIVGNGNVKLLNPLDKHTHDSASSYMHFIQEGE